MGYYVVMHEENPMKKLIGVGKWIFYGGLAVIMLIFVAEYLAESIGFASIGRAIMSPLPLVALGIVGLLLLYVVVTPFYVLYKQVHSHEVRLSKTKLAALFVPLIILILFPLFPVLVSLFGPSGSTCSFITHDELLPYSEKMKHLNQLTNAISPYYYITLSSIAGLSFLAAIIRFFRRKDDFSRLWLGLWIFAFILLAPFVIADRTHATRYRSQDARRMIDLQQVSIALDMYKEDHNRYPVITSDKSPPSRWQELKPYLKGEYMNQLPDDNCFESNADHQYDYKSDEGGNRYVLKALLTGNLESGLPDNDHDGEILEIDCGNEDGQIEFKYCIVPEDEEE